MKTPSASNLEVHRADLLRCAFVCPHTDADGLASGALALRLRGEHANDAVLLSRGETPFASPSMPAARPIAILDWGVRAFDGPALIVDHHAPETEPGPGQIVVSGYRETPEVSTSVLMARISGPDSIPWIAAVGAVGDLGRKAWELPDIRTETRKYIQELVPLINAPRRCPDGPVETALELLTEATSPSDALGDPRIGELRHARDEWRSAYQGAIRTAPEVKDGIALIRLTSPYQVHPLIAQAWSGRLAPSVVIAANFGYIPDRVNFSVRGGQGNLRARLRAALPDEEGEFAHGHDRATGGSLTEIRFEELIAKLRS